MRTTTHAETERPTATRGEAFDRMTRRLGAKKVQRIIAAVKAEGEVRRLVHELGVVAVRRLVSDEARAMRRAAPSRAGRRGRAVPCGA